MNTRCGLVVDYEMIDCYEVEEVEALVKMDSKKIEEIYQNNFFNLKLY